jgi:hypothetical protein
MDGKFAWNPREDDAVAVGDASSDFWCWNSAATVLTNGSVKLKPVRSLNNL